MDNGRSFEDLLTNMHEPPTDEFAFTDREDLTDAFWDKLSQVESADRGQLISYWGFGGIGKSQLLRKIKRDLEGKKWPAEYSFLKVYHPIYYSFQNTQSIVDLLVYLRIEISEVSKDFCFPTFDYCLSKYESMIHKSAINKPAGNNKRAELMDNVSKIASLFYPNIYEAINAGKEVWETVCDAIKQKYAFQGIEEMYAQIDRATESNEKMLEKLCFCFAYDFFEKRNPTRDKRVYVFLLDTFERLIDTEGAEEYVLIFMDYMMHHNNIMLVVAGREELKGVEKTFKGKFNVYERFSVSHLERKYAALYLFKKWGIEDTRVIKRMVDLSEGYPLYLYIGAKTYWNMSEEERSNPETVFNIDKSEMIEKYMHYLPEGGGERRVLRLMSSMINWNEKDFQEVYEEVFPYFWAPDEESYQKVVKSSLIQTDEKGSRFLHQVVSDAVYEDPAYPDNMKANANKAILDLYKRRFEEDILYYKNRLADLVERSARMKTPFTEEEEKSIVRIMVNSSWDLKSYGVDNVNKYIEALKKYRDTATNSEYIDKNLIDLMERNDRSRDAIALAEEVLKNKAEELGEDSFELEPYLRQLYNLYPYREYNEKLGILQKLKKAVESNPDKGIMDVLGVEADIADMYYSIGEGKKAEEIVGGILLALEGDQSSDYRKKMYSLRELTRLVKSKEARDRIAVLARGIVNNAKTDEKYTRREIVNLLDSLKDMYDAFGMKTLSNEVYEEMMSLTDGSGSSYGDLESEDLYEDVLAEKKKRRSLIELNRTIPMAERNNAAKEITEEIIDFIKENKPDDVQRLRWEKRNLVSYLKELKDFDEALNIQQELIDLAKASDEYDAFDVIREMTTLANLYIDMGEKQRGLALIKEIKEKIMDVKDTDLDRAARTMSNLSYSLQYDCKDYGLAAEYINEAVDMMVKKYGDETHEQVLNYKERLADILETWGKKNEAEVLREEINTVRNSKNENNPEKRIRMIRDEGRECFRNGQNHKGCELFDTARLLSEEYHGKDADFTLGIIKDYADYLNNAPKKASLLYEDLINNHPNVTKKDILSFADGLSDCYYKMNRIDEAIDVLKEGIDTYVESSVARDRNDTWAIDKLADYLMMRHDDVEAIHLLEGIVNDHLVEGTIDDYSFIQLVNKLGKQYVDTDDCEKATGFLDDIISSYNEQVGGVDSKILEVVNNRAEICLETGRYDEALETTAKYYEEYIEGYGLEGSVGYIEDLSNIYLKAEVPEKAISLLKKCIEDYSDTHDKMDRTHLGLVDELARVYETSERGEEAIEVLDKAILDYKKDIGGMDYRIRGSVHRLADIYVKTGNLEKAISLLDENIKEIEDKSGKINNDILSYMEKKANIYAEVGKEEGGIRTLQEGIEEYKTKVSGSDPTIRRAITTLADIYLNAGASDKATTLLENFVNEQGMTATTMPSGILKKLTIAKAESGVLEESRKLLESVIREKRENGDYDLRAIKHLADLEYKYGNKEEAIRRLEQGIEDYREETGNEVGAKKYLLELAELCHEVDSEKEQKIRTEAATIVSR